MGSFELNELQRRLGRLSLAVVLIFAGGTVGYMILEDMNLVDAFYMTAITLTTVGFGEVTPLSPEGRLYTTLLIFVGVGIIAVSFGLIGEYLLTASLAGELRKRQAKRMIDKLQDHIIICGYGRVGQSAALTLRDSNRGMVVLERDPDVLKLAREHGFLVLEGDASRDEALREAGIERAWGLIICTGEDSLNLFIVLSARALNPDLYIVTRSIEAENERKMRRAGADRVVSPYQIGGKHMANIMIRPHVTDFFDVVTLDNGMEIWVEELIIEASSSLVGQTVGEADIRRRTGVTLVAVYRHAANSTLMPHAGTQLEAGDELIVLGTREQLTALEELTESRFGHVNKDHL